MTRPISYAEFKRRTFNSLLTECFVKMHAMANGLDENCSKVECFSHMEKNVECPKHRSEMAAKMAKAFFIEELNLKTATVSDTKNKLSDATTFVKDCVKLCESIADDKTEYAKENGIKFDDDETGDNRSEEDKSEIEKLFDEKTPTVTIDAIVKASVNSMVEEKEKSQEIKDAIDIAKNAADVKTLEETVNRLSRRGPTSLMNAIMTSISECAVNDVASNLENQSPNISQILAENAEEIRVRSLMVYSLYETVNAFGIKTYSPKEVETIANKIYHNVD